MATKASCLDTGLQPLDILVLPKQMKKMDTLTSLMKRLPIAELEPFRLPGHNTLPYNLDLMGRCLLIDPTASPEQIEDPM